MPSAETYFITWKGRRDGPYTIGQIEELLKNGDIGLLHTVETLAGPVSLRQLLETTGSMRYSAQAPSSSPVDEKTAAASSADSIEDIGEPEALRLYALCGWCFALPPLAWKAWQQASRLAGQGHIKTAHRIKALSTGLAIAGVCLWVLLWRIW